MSDDGRTPWRQLKTYTFTRGGEEDANVAPLGFAARFGVAPGGGVLTVDHTRTGHFFSPAETAAGRSPDWRSLFSY